MEISHFPPCSHRGQLSEDGEYKCQKRPNGHRFCRACCRELTLKHSKDGMWLLLMGPSRRQVVCIMQAMVCGLGTMTLAMRSCRF